MTASRSWLARCPHKNIAMFLEKRICHNRAGDAPQSNLFANSAALRTTRADRFAALAITGIEGTVSCLLNLLLTYP
jgi:hypothetical protein